MICGCGWRAVAVILICMSLAARFAVSIDYRVYLLFLRYANADSSYESQKATDSSSLYRFLGCFYVSLRQPTASSSNANLLVSTQIQHNIT